MKKVANISPKKDSECHKSDRDKRKDRCRCITTKSKTFHKLGKIREEYK